MKNTVDNTPEVKKESNWDFKRLCNAAIISMITVLGIIGVNKCSNYQITDRVPDNEVVEKKGNSVAFSCVFNDFYRGGATNPGFYDFNGRINKRDGIYEGVMELKDENGFFYETILELETNNKTELEEKILNKIRSSLPQTPSKDEWSRAEKLVKEACMKVE